MHIILTRQSLIRCSLCCPFVSSGVHPDASGTPARPLRRPVRLHSISEKGYSSGTAAFFHKDFMKTQDHPVISQTLGSRNKSLGSFAQLKIIQSFLRHWEAVVSREGSLAHLKSGFPPFRPWESIVRKPVIQDTGGP
jgi:hypothetical protein